MNTKVISDEDVYKFSMKFRLAVVNRESIIDLVREFEEFVVTAVRKEFDETEIAKAEVDSSSDY